MRPALLTPLFAPVSSLEGIGPKVASQLAQLLPLPMESPEPRIAALCFHLPHRVIDRTLRPGIAFAVPGTIVTLDLHIDRHEVPARGLNRVPYKVYGHDETGEIALTFFRARSVWLEKALPVGEKVTVSGAVEWFNGRASMVHPDHMVLAANAVDLPLIEPVYGLTGGLSAKVLRKAILQALGRLPVMPDWMHPALAMRERFPSFGDALKAVHNPIDGDSLSPLSPSRRRLAYDELLAGQLALALVRARVKKQKGRAFHATGALERKVQAAFSFPLTGAQLRSVDEIRGDLENREKMLRLLQGDVGSGKTIVALSALAHCVEAGAQGALMAPTEVLARQHFATIAPLAEKSGLNVRLLTGRDKGVARKQILDDLISGAIDILIGTHALFQDDVIFKDLGLAVVDEQHRFGVHQRLMLNAKGAHADMLVMTATPIPRTLVLTLYGDMDVSRLDEKPAGRQPIKTVATSLTKLDALIERTETAVAKGEKIYWICPLVDESDVLPVTSAIDRHKALSQIFGGKVGLVHGRMSGMEKDAAMAAFKQGETRILVATTVIEVGVDVPDATIIVIEHAERFGLSQLHQLRGRVGRGSKASSCVLLYKEPLGETARARLDVMRRTEDGFLIAEEDLRLRGQGELLGTRQSGTVGFRLAEPEIHRDLMEIARNDARLVMETDPDLQSARGQALRVLLYLFEQDNAVRLLQSG